MISQLARYVPYRFQTPFFPTELRGLLDSKKNAHIIKLTSNSFDRSESPCIYKFVGDYIELHPSWFTYIHQNIIIVEGFCLWQLGNYIQARNPNIPNIGKKLFAPPLKRNLSQARKIWDCVLEKESIECIFSKTQIRRNAYSIDHYIPWSFVMHDMNWNLCPIQKEVNSSKSNNIPRFEEYFLAFTKIQYKAFHIVYNYGNEKLLEDYSIVFNNSIGEIFCLDEKAFTQKLYDLVLPLSQIAINAGFSSNWTY